MLLQLLVTSILPEHTPEGGMVAVMEVADQLTTLIGVLPILTEPLLVKLLPLITMLLPGVPFCVMLVMEGTLLMV